MSETITLNKVLDDATSDFLEAMQDDIRDHIEDNIEFWGDDLDGLIEDISTARWLENKIGDRIMECADSGVPVYNSELLDLAAEDNALATTEPEIGPAFDGSPTPINIIAANVYEQIEQHLYKVWRNLGDYLDIEIVSEPDPNYDPEALIRSFRGVL